MQSDSAERIETDGVTRRHVLQGTATAGVAVGSTGAFAGSAVAQEDASAGLFDACVGGWDEAPANFPTVDVRNDTIETSNVPEGEDEILLYVHGWIEAVTGGGLNQAYVLWQALRQHDYDHPVVAGLWPSNDPNWWGIKDVGDEAAASFADWIDEYLSANPDTTFRLVGHSMGGYTSLAICNELQGRQVLDSVSLLGASVDADAVCEDAAFGDGIANGAESVHNYHSDNDTVMCVVYWLGEFASPGLGCGGHDCDGGWFSAASTPDNFESVDVTDEVDGHCAYMRKDGQGCVDRIVADFDGTAGGNAGGDDGSWGYSRG